MRTSDRDCPKIDELIRPGLTGARRLGFVRLRSDWSTLTSVRGASFKNRPSPSTICAVVMETTDDIRVLHRAGALHPDVLSDVKHADRVR